MEGETIVDLIESYTDDIESVINHVTEEIDEYNISKKVFKEYESCMSAIQFDVFQLLKTIRF